jgi:hypothetical protein
MSWTVWVGGSEVNPGYLNKSDALRIAQAWAMAGYDDVIVERVSQ